MKTNTVYISLLITLTAFLGASPLHARQKPAPIAKTATSLEVEMIGLDNLSVPREFQVSLYENLVQEISKKGDFDLVYRDGNRNAETNQHLVRMHSTITAFHEGSERDRQVTTVKGATKIMVRCQFTDKQGTVLLQRDIEGQVRFFGNNLKATDDFAKKAAKAADEALSVYRASPQHRDGA